MNDSDETNALLTEIRDLHREMLGQVSEMTKLEREMLEQARESVVKQEDAIQRGYAAVKTQRMAVLFLVALLAAYMLWTIWPR